jgi:threonine dehydrogenase-like Zn-dependent dehydrogenase
MVNEITVLGSRCGPFAPALDLLTRKLIDVQSLIHARFPLKDGLKAMEKARERGVLKVVV